MEAAHRCTARADGAEGGHQIVSTDSMVYMRPRPGGQPEEARPNVSCMHVLLANACPGPDMHHACSGRVFPPKALSTWHQSVRLLWRVVELRLEHIMPIPERIPAIVFSMPELPPSLPWLWFSYSHLHGTRHAEAGTWPQESLGYCIHPRRTLIAVILGPVCRAPQLICIRPLLRAERYHPGRFMGTSLPC